MDLTDAIKPDTGAVNPYLPHISADPVPFFDELRATCPVATIDGMEGLPPYIISRYEDVRWALRNPDIFSSDLVAVDIGQDRPLIPLQIDPPQHAVYRRVIDPVLGPREVAGLEPEIRRLAGEVMDRFVDRGSVDAHTEFTVPLPCTVFLKTAGLPLDDLSSFLTWKDEIIRPGGGLVTPEEATERRHAAGSAVYAYFEKVLAERRENLGDDLFSRFLTKETDGRTMTQEEMLDLSFLFLIAGLDTVTSTLDCSLAFLAQHPEHRQRLVDDPSSTPAFVEELLRRETPVMQIVRVVTKPVELHGVEFAPGDSVILMLGAANTDEAEFGPTAGGFDPFREANRHLAFGGGPHRCLGSHLARLELSLMLEEWHRRIPDYEIEPGVELVYSPAIREIEHLPLVFPTSSAI